MIRAFNLDDLHKRYENESPEEKAIRYAENKERTERFLNSWKAFEAKYPEHAKDMVCHA